MLSVTEKAFRLKRARTAGAVELRGDIDCPKRRGRLEGGARQAVQDAEQHNNDKA